MMKKEKFESTFAIIHLSDLHIVSHNGDYSTSLHRMIDHIFEVTQNIQKIVIVFTGDLVERGDFSNSEETIYTFFNDLYKKSTTPVQALKHCARLLRRRSQHLLSQAQKRGMLVSLSQPLHIIKYV